MTYFALQSETRQQTACKECHTFADHNLYITQKLCTVCDLCDNKSCCFWLLKKNVVSRVSCVLMAVEEAKERGGLMCVK